MHKWAIIFIFHRSLIFIVSAYTITIDRGDILQIAFTTLIADRTVQRVICKQELHDVASVNTGFLTVGLDFHPWDNRRSACSNRLRDVLDLHEAHSAVSSNRYFSYLSLHLSWKQNLGTITPFS